MVLGLSWCMGHCILSKGATSRTRFSVNFEQPRSSQKAVNTGLLKHRVVSRVRRLCRYYAGPSMSGGFGGRCALVNRSGSQLHRISSDRWSVLLLVFFELHVL